MNKVLRTLILSDLFIMSSFGLIGPIFAIFILNNVAGAGIASAGIAITIQMFTKAVLQLVVGKWTDDERGNCRELYAMLAGSLIISMVPLGYILVRDIAHLYIMQITYGVGQALAYPSWKVLFNRYLNQDRAGYEFSIYDTAIGLGIACAAAIGGFVAENLSFQVLFVIVSIFSFFGSALLVYIFKVETTCRVKIALPATFSLKTPRRKAHLAKSHK